MWKMKYVEIKYRLILMHCLSLAFSAIETAIKLTFFFYQIEKKYIKNQTVANNVCLFVYHYLFSSLFSIVASCGRERFNTVKIRIIREETLFRRTTEIKRCINTVCSNFRLIVNKRKSDHLHWK